MVIKPAIISLSRMWPIRSSSCGMQHRLAAAESDTANSEIRKKVRPTTQVVNWNRSRKVVVLVAIGAGNVAAACRNEVGEDRVILIREGLHYHPGLPHGAVQPKQPSPHARADSYAGHRNRLNAPNSGAAAAAVQSIAAAGPSNLTESRQSGLASVRRTIGPNLVQLFPDKLGARKTAQCYTSSLAAGVTQLVECDLAKVDVAGSSPVSRSKLPEAPWAPSRRRGSQVVRQRSAKPLFVGSIPTPRLHPLSA